MESLRPLIVSVLQLLLTIIVGYVFLMTSR